MKIKLARIDDRLIHGQVATVWSKVAGATRIIIVAEEVNNDEIRKTLVKQAAPPGIKASVVNVEKAVKVYNNPKYMDDPVFYLFTNPTEVLEMVEAGIPIKSINIGGMQFKTGKKQITKAVSVEEKDIAAFRKLQEYGLELDLRVIATDPKQDFATVLDKAGV